MGKLTLQLYLERRDRQLAKSYFKGRAKTKGPNTFKRKWGMSGVNAVTKDGRQNWISMGVLSKLKPTAKRSKAKQKAYLAVGARALALAEKRLAYRLAAPVFSEPEPCLYDDCMALRNTMPEYMGGNPGQAMGWDHSRSVNWQSFLADWSYDKSGKAWVGVASVHMGKGLECIEGVRRKPVTSRSNWSMNYDR